MTLPNWLWDLIGVIPWTMLAGSVALSVWGLAWRSWPLLAWAALPSLVFSFMAGFSIGWMTLLLPCLQIAGAFAVGSRSRWWGWLLAVGGGAGVWWLVVRLIW